MTSWRVVGDTRSGQGDYAHKHHRHRRSHGTPWRGRQHDCGTFGEYRWHFNYIEQVLVILPIRPRRPLPNDPRGWATVYCGHTCAYRPHPQQITQSVLGAARHVGRFGLEPKIALCARSQFGSMQGDTGQRLRDAMAQLDLMDLDFQYEGEMNIDAALDPELRARVMPQNRMDGIANVLIFAHADAASGVRNILKMRAGGLEVGSIPIICAIRPIS